MERLAKDALGWMPPPGERAELQPRHMSDRRLSAAFIQVKKDKMSVALHRIENPGSECFLGASVKAELFRVCSEDKDQSISEDRTGADALSSCSISTR